MPRGRLPTGMLATTLSDAASMTVTLFERSLETYTSGSAPALAAAVPSATSVSSATPTLPSTIAPPPSRREPAAAIRHRGAERVEVFPAHVPQHRERPERPPDVFPLAPSLGDRPRHAGIDPAIVDGQEQYVGGGRVAGHGAAPARHAPTGRGLDLGAPRRPIGRHTPARELALLDQDLGEGVGVHRHARHHVERPPLAALVAQAVVRGADV